MNSRNKFILIINGGSSSLKLSLFNLQKNSAKPAICKEEKDKQSHGQCPETALWSETCYLNLLKQSSQGLCLLLSEKLKSASIDFSAIVYVVHRVVHGGKKLRKSCIVDQDVLRTIKDLQVLAPVHNPIAVKLIEAASELLAHSKQFAVFDTSFHASLPELAYTYAIPKKWREEFGICRFGFHGINHAYCARKAAEILGSDKSSKYVICHLGNGCSLSAVDNGLCVDTSMGFTPMEGLPMGTRSGSIDPGIILYLQTEHLLSVQELDHALNHESGLLALSGFSKNMQEIEQEMQTGNQQAKLAFDYFSYAVTKQVGAMAAALSGIDALIFTGGIGENSTLLRLQVCRLLSFLGISIDESANESCQSDSIISKAESAVKILRLQAGEDLEMLEQCRAYAGLESKQQT